MIEEQAQDVLLDAEIVGDHFEFVILGRRAGFAHLFRPRRSGKVDGTLLPIVCLDASDTAGEFLASHEGKLLGFEDELIGGRAIGGDHAA